MANQSVTISFVTKTASEAISLSVDMDTEKNEELNEGRTSEFIFGDEAFFRVFSEPIEGITIGCYPSDGVIASYGEKTVDVQEYIQFIQPPLIAGGTVEDNISSLDKPAFSDFVAEGLPPGSSPCGVISVDPIDSSQANASLAGPGVYDTSYKAKYHSFSIKKDSIPSDESYPIVIVIVGS